MRDEDRSRWLAAYRLRTVPDDAAKAALLERLLAEDRVVTTPSWPRVAVAAGLSFAIAAALLLLLRGVVVMVDETPAHHEAIDELPEPAREHATTGTPAEHATAPVPTSPALAAPAEPPAEPTRASAAPTKAARPRVDAAQRDAPVEPAPTTDAIRTEGELLARAQAALRDGDAAGALRLLEEHATRFPAGPMQLEHDALRSIADCTIERTDDAVSRARTLLARADIGTYAKRIRHACGL